MTTVKMSNEAQILVDHWAVVDASVDTLSYFRRGNGIRLLVWAAANGVMITNEFRPLTPTHVPAIVPEWNHCRIAFSGEPMSDRRFERNTFHEYESWQRPDGSVYGREREVHRWNQHYNDGPWHACSEDFAASWCV